jgi:hypothetical protein
MRPDFQLCPYCGQPLRLVWVHGHGQCAVCHTNVDECCRGESAGGEKPSAEGPPPAEEAPPPGPRPRANG